MRPIQIILPWVRLHHSREEQWINWKSDVSIERGRVGSLGAWTDTNLYYHLVDEYFSHYLPCEETAPPALSFQVTPASPSQLQHSLIIITTKPRQLQPGSLCFHIYASFNLDYTVGQNSDKIFIALEISCQ